MRKVIYSMSVSLDGFIAGPGGEIDWSVPDEELHRFHNDRVREQSAQLLGRRLYETMLYFDEDAERDPEATETMLDFARSWQPLPKIVFSRTLTEVQGKATRLAQGTPAEELERLKAEPGEGDTGVGGAGLAAELIAAGLVDDFQLFVAPIILGGGVQYLRDGLAEKRWYHPLRRCTVPRLTVVDRGGEMSASVLRRVAVAVVAAAGLGLAGPAGVAQADHDNARELCSEKYAGTYTHYDRYPIYTGDVVGGWISINYRVADGDFVHWCAVTIRKYHGEAKYTMIRIARTGDDSYREDSGQYTRYAGPVMRGADWGQPGMCVFGRGRIGDWIQDFKLCNGIVAI